MATETRTISNLNLRKSPRTGAVLTVIPKGGTVVVKSHSGGWANVTYKSMTGWVSESYLTTVVLPSKGKAATVTEIAAIDNLFSHYNEPYIWDENDCSQFMVNRWRDWGYAPEANFRDASADRMYDNFRSGKWDATKQDPANPARLSAAFYAHPDNLDNAYHVQFTLWRDIGLGENGGTKTTNTIAEAKERDARSKVAPINYNPKIYVLAGIYLPDYQFRP